MQAAAIEQKPGSQFATYGMLIGVALSLAMNLFGKKQQQQHL
jgi:hypothetical protein